MKILVRSEFIKAIAEYQGVFGAKLDDPARERLADFCELVFEHNSLLHLVAPCSAEEFAIRHVLESLKLLEYLPAGTKFADVGAGGGFPSLPALIAQPGLSAILIESKEKKAEFLRAAIEELGLSSRAGVIGRQFDEVRDVEFDVWTCRALDKFTEKVPRLLRWAKRRPFVLFGGPSLGAALTATKMPFEPRLIPMSERRYLFVGRAASAYSE